MSGGIGLVRFINNTLYKNAEVLQEEYFPEHIEHREEEIEWLSERVFSAPFNNIVPEHTLIYGATGTGKTIVAKKLVDELNQLAEQRSTSTKAFYLNLNGITSTYHAIQTLVSLVGNNTQSKQGLPFENYRDEFFSILDNSKKKIILVLDEFEKLLDRGVSQGDQFLYQMLRGRSLGKLKKGWVSLVLITNRIKIKNNLSASVKSSLGNHYLFFKEYNEEQLFKILRSRAEVAFNKDVCPDNVLKFIAQSVRDGDARKGLRLLRVTGEIAQKRITNEQSQKKNSDIQVNNKLTLNDAEKAKEEFERVGLQDHFSNLKEEERIILWLLSEMSKKYVMVGSLQLYQTYEAICKKHNIEPVSRRWINKHLENFCNNEILQGIVNRKARGQPMSYTLTKDITPELITELIVPYLPKALSGCVDLSDVDSIQDKLKIEFNERAKHEP